jgi:hypothetical protein
MWQMFYEIKWVGYVRTTWVPRDNLLLHAREVLCAFEALVRSGTIVVFSFEDPYKYAIVID